MFLLLVLKHFCIGFAGHLTSLAPSLNKYEFLHFEIYLINFHRHCAVSQRLMSLNLLTNKGGKQRWYALKRLYPGSIFDPALCDFIRLVLVVCGD